MSPSPNIRKRTLSRFSGKGVVRTITAGVSTYTFFPYTILTKQETTSFENPGWVFLERLKKNPRYRALPRRKRAVENRNFGSPFTTERQRHWVSHPKASAIDPPTVPGGVVRYYNGPLTAYKSSNTGLDNGFPDMTRVSENELIVRGTKFIADTLPTNPAAGVAVLLGELREGLPQIPGKAFFNPRNRTPLGALRQAGSEYVNVEFGILPLAKDLLKIADTVKKSEKILAQYTRDSGRHIRRRASLPETTTTVISSAGNRTIGPGIPGGFFDGSVTGECMLTRVTKTRWSFSACYTYYLDPGKTALGRLNRQVQEANRLYGVRITPELIWELTPWSWLADYVANTGDVLTNISALLSDSLVIRWAYVMCEQTVTDTYTNNNVKIHGVGTGFSQTFQTHRKVRRSASPYGFGLDPDTFSSRQWAVLGALGISKGPRQL